MCVTEHGSEAAEAGPRVEAAEVVVHGVPCCGDGDRVLRKRRRLHGAQSKPRGWRLSFCVGDVGAGRVVSLLTSRMTCGPTAYRVVCTDRTP